MYGWKARLGVIVPSANVTMEPDLCSLPLEGVSLHFSRIKITKDTPEELENMVNNVPEAAERLKDAHVDVILFGCTGGSFIKEGWSEKIVEKIENTTGIKGTTTSLAAVEALKEVGINKLVLFSPYEGWLNQKAVEFLEKRGFSTLKEKGLSLLEDPLDQALFPPEQIYKEVKEILVPEADGVFISCTNFRGMKIVEQLEQDIGKPVVTSNQASIWMMLKMLGIKAQLKGFGTLLR